MFTLRFSRFRRIYLRKYTTDSSASADKVETITVFGKTYVKDEFTNVTPRILSLVDKKLLHRDCHPLNLVKQVIANYFYTNFLGRTGNTIFSVYDKINPVVTVKENFDSLLIPESHESRRKSDTYYINKDYLLRSHTTAHQAELVKMGLDNFLIFGDSYRRDEIDSTHYPVFHQADGVYTLSQEQIKNMSQKDIIVFENSEDTNEKQGDHTAEASKFIEDHLKDTLIGLIKKLYKQDVEHKWVPAYFPFTHPSWELEIMINDQWIETLGCGIIRHEILKNAGAGDRIGWAFGLGLERLAMHRYKIPDIRLFWSEDIGFVTQFVDVKPDEDIVYQHFGVQPPCVNDMSFFLSEDKPFHSNEFYDIVRSVGGDFVEQVKLIDEFFHPKKQRVSRTYRIVYRHMERPLTKSEVNVLHTRISNAVVRTYDVTLR